ncbi:Cyclin-U4-1 (CycU4, partial [Durusdinium trenchii]
GSERGGPPILANGSWAVRLGSCREPSLPMAEVHDFTNREAEVLAEVAEMLNQMASFPGKGTITCFDSPNVPPITLRDYLLRLWRYMNCSIECFVTALAYLDRLQQKDLKVGILNVHTVFLGCL